MPFQIRQIQQLAQTGTDPARYFSLTNYREAERVASAWNEIADRAETCALSRISGLFGPRGPVRRGTDYAATMDTIPGRGLGVGVSIGNQPPQVVNVFTPQTTDNNGTFFDTFLGRNHFNNAANNARIMRFTVKVDQPGKYPLRITMVDPTMVVQKVIIHDAPLPKSYFGPLEASLNGPVASPVK